MANSEHLSILKQGVEAWNQWRPQGPHWAEVKAADLNGADLSGSNLRGANLFVANLSQANLNGADLSQADLSHANLSQADLSQAILLKADLSDADLSGATLLGANLTHGDLSRANLSKANLHGADCREVDLSGADLQAAILWVTNLSGAILKGVDLVEAELRELDLNGADLSGAILLASSIRDVDFSQAKGLDRVSHWGPSSLDIDTIYRSQGKITDVFLRGAGVPNEFIAFIQGLAARSIEYYSCFISYNHTDKAFARLLHDGLQARGINCWLDERRMLPGDDIHEQVAHGIRLWDKTLLCASEASLRSWWVDNRDRDCLRKRAEAHERTRQQTLALIPLDLDGYLFRGNWSSGKAEQVRSRLVADFTGWKMDNRKFEEQLERVIQALRADPDTREAPPPSRL